MTTGLAAQLFREVRPEFFRVLTGPLCRLYVDVLDALEREASQRSQGLERDEALAIVEQALDAHALSLPDDDVLMSEDRTGRDRARAVLEALRQAGWLQEEERSDWRK